MKTSLSSHPEYSARWLRDTILGHLMDRREPPSERERQERLIWKKFIQNLSGAYEYDEVLESYGNLTRRQVMMVSDFIETHAYDPQAIRTIARAAHKASTDGDHYLDNTLFLFDALKSYDSDPNGRRSEWYIYLVISGFQKSIATLSEERREGHRAVAQFIMSQCSGRNEERFTHYNFTPEMIINRDQIIKDFLMKNPSSLDNLISLINENPELTSAALVGVLSGSTPSSLASGTL